MQRDMPRASCVDVLIPNGAFSAFGLRVLWHNNVKINPFTMPRLQMLLSAADSASLLAVQQHCADEVAARLVAAEKNLRHVRKENRELRRLLAGHKLRQRRDGN